MKKNVLANCKYDESFRSDSNPKFDDESILIDRIMLGANESGFWGVLKIYFHKIPKFSS